MGFPFFRRFSIWLLVGLLGTLGLAGLFNRIVDPFWYYRDTSIDGFNAVKTKFRRFERHVKPAIVAREKPEAIVLGSSFAEIGLDPRNPSFTDGGRLAGYNFGIAGADWPMTRCYLEFALRNADPKRIVVGIPLTDLPTVDCAEQVATMGNPGVGALLFSARALRASVQTVLEQRKQRPSHTREGLYFYARAAGAAQRSFSEMFAARLRSQSCDLRKLGAATAPITPVASPRRRLDLAGLRQVVHTAVERGIELRLVIYPQHAFNLELDVLCGGGVDRWDALEQMARAVEEAGGGSSLVQLWEFFGYNDVTGEPVAPDMKYWQDPQHFNVEVGNMMLGEMFGAPPADHPMLGRRVVPGAQDAARRGFDAARQAFIAANAWFYPGLARVLPE
ncbi:MAG: hypothetical protein LJE97_08985 [Betaproteobacteria bacterium]|jgi:hypothetical protein|nr:hypothetical protein [Betaproteobacteria bacterium]